MANSPLPGGPNIIKTPISVGSGQMNDVWQRWYVNVIQRIENGLDIIGRFTGQIGASATVEGHAGTLASTIQHLTPSGQLVASQLTGTIASAQLPAADPAAQGAVVLPAGAPSNVLDTAAFEPASAFDPAGAAATALTNAEAFATAGDAGTLTAAKAYTDSKVVGATGTIHLGPYTVGGTQGSISVSNGLVTAFVDPT